MSEIPVKVDNCGCCDGVEAVTPLDITNRPALDELRYRIGTHSAFFQSMIARLSSLCDGTPKECQTGKGLRPLRDKLTARNPDDPAIALLDAWALVADVMTFYQEKLANEGFLRTAQDRRSLYELGKLVGYQPRPGVAAQVFLALEVEAPPTVTTAVGLANPGMMPRNLDVGIQIPQGTRAKSTPAPGTEEQPQVFETSANFLARPGWNEIPISTAGPYTLSVARLFQLTEFRFQGIGLRLQPNDLIVFAVGGKGHKARRVVQVREDNERRVTTVHFVRDLMTEEEFIASLRTAAERYQRELAIRQQSEAYREDITQQIKTRLQIIETHPSDEEMPLLLRLDFQAAAEIVKPFVTTVIDDLRYDAELVYKAIEKEVRTEILEAEHARQMTPTVWLQHQQAKNTPLRNFSNSLKSIDPATAANLHLVHRQGIESWEKLFPLRDDAKFVSCLVKHPAAQTPMQGAQTHELPLGEEIALSNHRKGTFQATFNIVASQILSQPPGPKGFQVLDDQSPIIGDLEHIETELKKVKVKTDSLGRCRVGIYIKEKMGLGFVGYGEVECVLGDGSNDLVLTSSGPYVRPVVEINNLKGKAENIGEDLTLVGNSPDPMWLRCERKAGDSDMYFTVNTIPISCSTVDEVNKALKNLSVEIRQLPPPQRSPGLLGRFLGVTARLRNRIFGPTTSMDTYDPPPAAVLTVRIVISKQIGGQALVDLTSVVRQIPVRVSSASDPSKELAEVASEMIVITGGDPSPFNQTLADLKERLAKALSNLPRPIVAPPNSGKTSAQTFQEAYEFSKANVLHYAEAKWPNNLKFPMWNGRVRDLEKHVELSNALEIDIAVKIDDWLSISSKDALHQKVSTLREPRDCYAVYFRNEDNRFPDVVDFLAAMRASLVPPLLPRPGNFAQADLLLSKIEFLREELYSPQDALESAIFLRRMVIPIFQARLQVLKWFEQALKPHLRFQPPGSALLELDKRLKEHETLIRDALRLALAAEKSKTDPKTDSESPYLVLKWTEQQDGGYQLIQFSGVSKKLDSGTQLAVIPRDGHFFYLTGTDQPGLHQSDKGRWLLKKSVLVDYKGTWNFTDLRVYLSGVLNANQVAEIAWDVRARLDDQQLKERLQETPVDAQDDWWGTVGVSMPPSGIGTAISGVTPELLNLQELLAAQLLRLGVIAEKPTDDKPARPSLEQALDAFRRIILVGGGLGSREELEKALSGFRDLIPQVLAALNLGDQAALLEVLRQYRSVPAEKKPSVWVLRTKAKVFGWNAPTLLPGAVLDEQRSKDLAKAIGTKDADLPDVANKIREQFVNPHPNSRMTSPEESETQVYLDGAFEKMLPGTPVLIETLKETKPGDGDSPSGETPPDDEPTAEVYLIPNPHLVVASQTRPRSAYGLSNETTAIQLDRAWWKANIEPFSVVRTTRVHCEAEALIPDLEPLDEELSRVYELDLEGLYSGLSPDKKLILSGVPMGFGPDSKVRFSELIEIHEVRIRLNSEGYGARYHTRLKLRTPLKRSYVRSSVRINANVVEATHGESQSEILGGGRGSEPLAKYRLKSLPLTHIPAPTETGVKAELSLTVNGTEWTLQESLVESGQTDRHFTMQIGPGGETHIQFGDGEHGSRLPTGHSNIKVQYRSGLGFSGNVPANRIDQLVGAVLGLKGVINPLPATSGADPDRAETIRERIPIGLSALDRIVSVGDYQDFAEQFGGVSKAHTETRADGILVTIAGHSAEVLRSDHLIVRSLIGAFRQFSNDMTKVDVLSHTPVLIGLRARVALRSKVRWEEAERRLRSLLLKHFSFEKAKFLGRVEPAQIIEVLHQDPDVIYIDLDGLNPIREEMVNQAVEFDSTRQATSQTSKDPADPAAKSAPTDDTNAQTCEGVTVRNLGSDSTHQANSQTHDDLVKGCIEEIQAQGPRWICLNGACRLVGAELCFFSETVRDTIRLSQIEEQVR